MQDVLVCAGQRTQNLSTNEDWQNKVRLVLGRLAENERRWVAALLSGAVGWAGVTGLDVKTVRAGRVELENDLNDCPAQRIRRPGAGRVPVENKRRTSNAN